MKSQGDVVQQVLQWFLSSQGELQCARAECRIPLESFEWASNFRVAPADPLPTGLTQVGGHGQHRGANASLPREPPVAANGLVASVLSPRFRWFWTRFVQGTKFIIISTAWHWVLAGGW